MSLFSHHDLSSQAFFSPLWVILLPCPGLEIATDMVANAIKTLNLATKNLSLVATLATMFL